MNLTKTPYLVLFVLLGAVGVGTASALMTITLAGNVIITDDLTVDSSTLVVDSANDKVGIGTTTPDEELEVVGNILATPIVGQWDPDFPTLVTSTDFVEFDNQKINTDTTYYGWTAGNDHIVIKKAGLYLVTVNVLLENGAPGEVGVVDVWRFNSAETSQDRICRLITAMAGFNGNIGCSTIHSFAANDRVKLEDDSTQTRIAGRDTSDYETFLNIQRLN